MLKITHITQDFAIAAQIGPEDFASPEDFAQLAHLGFRSVLNNRPDREGEQANASASGGAHARLAGLEYGYVPVASMSLLDEANIEAEAAALAQLPKPILAHCKSGLRSALLWALAEGRTQGSGNVLGHLARAGIDGSIIEEDLRAFEARRQVPGGLCSCRPQAANGARQCRSPDTCFAAA